MTDAGDRHITTLHLNRAPLVRRRRDEAQFQEIIRNQATMNKTMASLERSIHAVETRFDTPPKEATLIKVTRSALQNAASIAGLVLTTGAFVAEKPEKASAALAGSGGCGMPGNIKNKKAGAPIIGVPTFYFLPIMGFVSVFGFGVRSSSYLFAARLGSRAFLPVFNFRYMVFTMRLLARLWSAPRRFRFGS